MTGPKESASKIETGTILGVASFCVSVIVATVSFGNMTNDRFDKIEAHFRDVDKRICAVEANIKTGDCAR